MSKDDDAVHRMLDEIGRRRTPDEALAMTATQVFLEEEISDVELDALALTGYAAVESEGGAWPVAGPAPWPQECPSSICQLLDAGVSNEQLDARSLSVEDLSILALVGLFTIVGERFMRADADN